MFPNVGPTTLADRPILLLGILLMVLGVQTLSLGLVGEIIIFTHARNIREYQVAEVIRGSSPQTPRAEPTRPVAVPSPPSPPIPAEKAAAS